MTIKASDAGSARGARSRWRFSRRSRSPAQGARQTLRKRSRLQKTSLPFFQAKCQNCHHPGRRSADVATTYEEARPWRARSSCASESRDAAVALDKTVGFESTRTYLLAQRQRNRDHHRVVDGGAVQGQPADSTARS